MLKNLIPEITKELLSGNYNSSEDLDDLLKKFELPQDQRSVYSKEILNSLNKTVFPSISNLELFITYNCVLACDYCFAAEKQNDKSKIMSYETAIKAVDFLFQNSGDEKKLSILFFGGEALMEFDLIKRIVPYALNKAKEFAKDLSFSITTNAVLLNVEKLKYFKDNNIRFLLSIDGIKSIHDKHRKFPNGKGSYDKIVSKIPLFKKYQPWMGVRMTVAPEAVSFLLEGIKELYSKGINQFLISPVEGCGWVKTEIEGFYEALEKILAFVNSEKELGEHIRISIVEDLLADNYFRKRNIWGCRAGRHSLTVDINGNIYPCSKMMFPRKLKNNCSLGSLDKGLDKIANRMKFSGIININRADCYVCEYKNSCAGGCFAVNYWATENMFKPDKDYCKFVKQSNILREKLLTCTK